jgi:hypothetical protein
MLLEMCTAHKDLGLGHHLLQRLSQSIQRGQLLRPRTFVEVVSIVRQVRTLSPFGQTNFIVCRDPLFRGVALDLPRVPKR